MFLKSEKSLDSLLTFLLSSQHKQILSFGDFFYLRKIHCNCQPNIRLRLGFWVKRTVDFQEKSHVGETMLIFLKLLVYWESEKCPEVPSEFPWIISRIIATYLPFPCFECRDSWMRIVHIGFTLSLLVLVQDADASYTKVKARVRAVGWSSYLSTIFATIPRTPPKKYH